MTQEKNVQSASSWIQLGLFTFFLFLLVAIPYTIYLKASAPKSVTQIVNFPTVVTRITPFPTIIPPQANISTTCFNVPLNFVNQNASPAAYFFIDKQKQLCYPPALPPFPFTWQSYTDYKNGYAIDIPSNWTDNSTTILTTTFHIFTLGQTASVSANPSVAFSWTKGADPYATQSGFLSQQVTRSGKNGVLYTKGLNFIGALFPLYNGYFLLQASRIDSAFYAFEHMLDSLKFISQ